MADYYAHGLICFEDEDPWDVPECKSCRGDGCQRCDWTGSELAEVEVPGERGGDP